MGIKGLDHVNINTSNMKDTLSFYTDLLDFTDGFRPPFDFPGAWLYAGGNAVIHPLEKSHNRACQIHAPEGKVIYGRDQLIEFLTGYTKSFPKGSFRVHHWIVNEESSKNNRIAIRWSFSAEHTGLGSFGEPTGAPVVIMAMTHAEMQEGLVVREYHAIDEISLWMQISSYSMS